MFTVLFSIVLSFGITYFIIPVIIGMAQGIRIHDIPDERKIHTAPKPSLGGLGIFAGIMLTVLVTVPFTEAHEFQYYIAAILVLFFVGIKDDLDGMSPFRKIIGQGIAALMVIYKGGIGITSLYGIFGMEQLPQIPGFLLTFFTVIVIINAINLIDGVDGLAASLGVMIGVVLGTYFFQTGLMPYALLSFALAGSLAAFLFFNFQPSRIFMGDTGSLLVGLICAILVLKFINVSPSSPFLAISAAPALGFTILLVPLLDCLRVFATRIVSRRSPFSPDKNHIHHLLLAAGLPHKHITLVLVGSNLLLIVLAYAIQGIGNNWLMVAITAVFFTAIMTLKFRLRKKHIAVTKTVGDKTALKLKQPMKMVSLTNNVTIEEPEFIKNI